MKTQTTGRNTNSRLWAIPGVKIMFIWNKTGFYVEQRRKHSGKLSDTKCLKCSMTIFLKFIQSNKDHAFTKTKFHVQDTKKLNCPASITLRDIVFFPDFKVRYINCSFSLFSRFFSPSFFIIRCKMNLENKVSYKTLPDSTLLFHFKKLFVVSSLM